MARPPFPDNKEYLQYILTDTYGGANYKNLREKFIGIDTSIRAESFTSHTGSGTINGAWFIDGGDMTIPINLRESRAYCVKGKYTQSLTGTNAIVRIETDSGRGTMFVKINGVYPTAIPGATNTLSAINFNADTSGLAKGYNDVVVAENLSAGVHTVELFAQNATQYVAVVGLKTRSYTTSGASFTGWKATTDTQLNHTEVKFDNQSGYPVQDVVIIPPVNAKNWNGTTMVQTAPFSIPAGSAYPLQFAFDGSVITGNSATETFTVSALYADSTGSIPKVVTTSAGIGSPRLTFSAGGWGVDNATPTGVLRAYSLGANKTVTFTTPASAFVITIQKEFGWGAVNILQNGVLVTSATSNDGVGGGFLQNVTISGLSAVNKTITLSSINAAAKPFVFTQIVLNEDVLYTPTVETLPLSFEMKHVPPFTPPNVRLNTSASNTQPIGIITWDPPAVSAVDLSNKKAPRINAGLVEQRVYSRFPTYCVYYGAGNDEILNQYDMVIIEPRAVTRTQVAAWQAKGIKVYGYVSFGEEDGQRVDIFDTASSVVGPHRDDMLGTGGYASYYNKGGNLYGEPNECQLDRQRIEGVKACAVSNPKYFGKDINVTNSTFTLTAGYGSLSLASASIFTYTSVGAGQDWILSNVSGLSVSKKYRIKFTVNNLTGSGAYVTPFFDGHAQPNVQLTNGTHDIMLPITTGTAPTKISFYIYHATNVVVGDIQLVQEPIGRCSKSCTHDTRTGYVTWLSGGACGAGFTKNNKYQRTASNACTNATCPSYAPRNLGCSQWQQSEVAWGQDFSQDDTFPDQNGIWNSTYINPLAPRWKQKLSTFYLPYVFGAQETKTETHAVSAHTGATNGSQFVFRTATWPVEDGATIAISANTVSGAFVYVRDVDFAIDATEGIITFDPLAGVDAGGPTLSAGQSMTITYTKKGLECDGLFMDTVDTVDVYPSSAFQAAFATMINDLKAEHPTRMFCSNRGFSILSSIIKSCSHVMFESFLADYDFVNDTYSKIVDPDSIAYNNGIKQQLRELRLTNRFDVLALNYCANDASGDELRSYIAEESYKEGYMSWSSTIDLQNPLAEVPISINTGKVRSNLWKLQFRKKGPTI